MKKIMLLYLSIQLFNMALGQYSDAVLSLPDSLKGHENLYGVLQNYYARYYATDFKKRCDAGVLFVRFRIDVKGNVADIEYNPDAPGYLRDYLTKGFSSTNGYWKPAFDHGKAIVSEWFLLPIVYVFRGCINYHEMSSQFLMKTLDTIDHGMQFVEGDDKNLPVRNYRVMQTMHLRLFNDY